jgi:opacity protein-like surface antigen
MAGGLADPIIPVPVAPPVPASIPVDWYAGIQIGAVNGSFDPGEAQTAFRETDASGQLYGVHAGVQRDFGAITAGIEVDYNFGEFANEEIAGANTADSFIDELAHLKLRAGTKIGGAFVYGTGGIAYAAGQIENLGPVVDVSDTAAFYGLGADMMVSDSISIGGEVLVHDFENMDETDVDVAFTTAQLRMSYHF